MKPLSIEFGINVKNRRIELEMSQQEVAAECDFDRGTIIEIEKGVSNVRLSTLATIADVLKVHPAELLKTD
jgi:transcriptional regulator with XRE-family HTH domain